MRSDTAPFVAPTSHNYVKWQSSSATLVLHSAETYKDKCKEKNKSGLAISKDYIKPDIVNIADMADISAKKRIGGPR